ncbi:MAG: NAD(P)-binding domain-containing protein [Candidatus Aenigmarchaeota archaeon]|nr:NAD(P)-binding domain-containing protein [Candidatus Aenigmarchaeota archaeon]
MKIIVVGGGAIGEALAGLLIKEKHDVVVIEKDEKLAEELAEKLDALVLHGDGTDKNILKDANIGNVDAVVSVTSDDKTNLMVCEVAKGVNVPNIITRINQSDNEGIFTKIGITNLINTTNTATLAFKKALEKPGKQLINLVAEGKGEVFEVSVSKDSKFTNKAVVDIAKGFTIAFIYRSDKLLIPKPETKIKEGDIITICSPLEEVKKIEKMI